MLTCHFNQDFDLIYGGLGEAFEAASQDGPLVHRRAILKEWRDWSEIEGLGEDIRPFLLDGFGVAIRFDQPIDGQNFMNRIYDCLIGGVKTETRP